MRIDILVPVYVDMWNEGVMKEALKIKAGDVDVHVCNLDAGVAAMESSYDVAMAGHLVVEKALELEAAGSDGIIVYCFKDPVLDACKEKLNIPVVGLRESAIALAGLIGDNIAVITSRNYSVACYRRALKGQVHQVACLGVPVLELLDYQKVYAALEQQVAEVVKKGSDVVVLGCGSILDVDFRQIEQTYGVPIVIPVHAAVSACEFLVRSGLKQSRVAYPTPEESKVL